MPTYEELLLDTRWKNKRLAIISRDLNKCSYCHNEALAKEHSHGKFVVDELYGVSFDGYHKFWRARSEDPASGETFSAVLLTKELDRKKQYVAYYTKVKSGKRLVIMLRESLKFKRPKLGCISIDDVQQVYERLLVEHREITKEILSEPETWNELEWVFTLGLQVHHLCYRKGKAPWEYNDDELKTACICCHEDIHGKMQIPVYDAEGVLIEHYTPCKRCRGVGWFPEYSHVEAGVCFRCKGAQYEELITAL